MRRTNRVMTAGMVMTFDVGDVKEDTGECNDFAYYGPFKVLTDFNVAKAAHEFKASEQMARSSDQSSEPETVRFIEWLCSNNYIERIEAQRCHVGWKDLLQVSV